MLTESVAPLAGSNGVDGADTAKAHVGAGVEVGFGIGFELGVWLDGGVGFVGGVEPPHWQNARAAPNVHTDCSTADRALAIASRDRRDSRTI